MRHSDKTQHRCQTEQMVLATDGQGIAAVLGGLALSALGVILSQTYGALPGDSGSFKPGSTRVRGFGPTGSLDSLAWSGASSSSFLR